MIADLTASHLAASSFEEQRGNNGIIIFEDIAAFNTAQMGGKGTSADVLMLSIQSFALPKVTVEPLETQYLNEKRKFAGGVSFDDVEVVFKDFVDVGTAQILKKWHEAVYDPKTGKIGLAKEYKRGAKMKIFAPNGEYVRTYTLVGVWPQNFDAGQIDMGSTEPLKITVNFAVDKAYATEELGGNANLEPNKESSIIS